MKLPPVPPQSVPPLDDRGGDASLPPLLSRTWWLFLNELAAAVGEGFSALKDAVLGARNLAHVGRLTKVSAAGTVGESSLTDDGTTVSGTEPLHIDMGAAPRAAQLLATANTLGALGLFCYSADNQQVLFDCYWVGAAGALYAANATCFRIVKQSGETLFYRASGQTVGTAVGTTGTAWVLVSALDLTSVNWGFGGNASPGYPIDVTGDVNVSGVFRKGGVAGVSGSQAVGVSLSVGTATIQYKDWAGANQSATVVTSVALNTSARTYAGGIRTA